ncbi:MAG: dienelactone hydrolase family protein [Candidatus Hydrogenedentes bacterium]|nr:dienelactone hydrolase family protein [Candidatus Hydrogenedentota bacterium]
MRLVTCTVLALAAVLLFLNSAERLSAQPRRTMRYQAGTPEKARAWQDNVRAELAKLLHIHDLLAEGRTVPLEPERRGFETRDGCTLETMTLRATQGRTFSAVVARPAQGQGPFPAVVCIHGHGGNRMTPFDPAKQEYRLFGETLARKGYLVISTDVGQHEVYEPGRTLMGERLWDLMRCVDYLETLPEADARRIGCAGLSLGGEMAMWLGAMDPRVAATSSCGFLTVMDQMENNHCMCWKLDGLRELVDFADIYALIAPRPLQCQNGRQEPETQFTVALAEKALAELRLVYKDLNAEHRVALHIHDGGHEIDMQALAGFLDAHLARPDTR